MNKLMLMGLLAVLGLSFAFTPPSGPEWGNYVQTCCLGSQAYYFGQSIYDTYYVWDGSCVYPDVIYYQEMDWMMWGYDGEPYVAGYFEEMMMTCDHYGETSPECLAAKSQFNSFAKSARNLFSTAYMGYMLAARQAISANALHGCGTTSAQVYNDLRNAAVSYRECIQNQCRFT